MIMDYLRSCYHSNMRPFADAPDVEVEGRWHWCQPNALALPIPHLYGSVNWDDDTTDVESIILGETGRGAWYSGESDPRFTGRRYCGPPDWWLNGSPLSAEGTPLVDESGYPPCCGPKPAGVDPMRLLELDGMPDIDPANELRIDQSTGLKLTHPGPNAGQLELDPPLPETLVSMVGLAMPSQFAVTNSPVTGAGTLTVSWNQQAAATFLSVSSAGAALPTFRPIAKGDLLSNRVGITSLSWEVATLGVIGYPGAASGEPDIILSENPFYIFGSDTLNVPGFLDPAYLFNAWVVADLLGDMIYEDAADFQPIDADLTALAGIAATGLLARTGAGTAAARTLTAGSTKVQVTDGDGVAGNPTVDLLRYPGQPLGLLNTATDESTSNAGPVNLTTDATFTLNTGASRDVLFFGVVETYNTTNVAVHTVTVEVDGTDYSFTFPVEATNTLYMVPIFLILPGVATGNKTVRFQFGTNAGTAHFQNRRLTALALT